MQIENLSWQNNNHRNNNGLLPKSIRGVIVGKSGCGKTTLLCNLLLQPGWLDYNKLMVYGKSLFQPEYRIIKKGFDLGMSKDMIFKVLKNSDEVIKSGVDVDAFLEYFVKMNKNINPIQAKFFESGDDVPDPGALDPHDKNLMVFDDLLLEKQNTCELYYVRGRHSNVDCFYLSQNYFKLPRQTIRENANFFCLFPQDAKNLNHIHQDHVAVDMPIEEFKNFCKEGWKQPHGFITIDLSSSKHNGRYRHGLDKFYIPHK